MADALVAVEERMVQHQRGAQRRGLLKSRRVQILAPEGRAWLREGGIEEPEIANADRAPLCSMISW